MRRRELIAGLGALGVFGTGAATVYGDFEPFDNESEVEPVELQRIEAPGSPAGTEAVPEQGRVTYLSIFATWCSVCQAKMEPLAEAAASVPDDVQFISVTNEPVGQTVDKQDVTDWWREHDGNWPVAHDADLELTRQIDAPGVPYSVVLDSDNSIVWAEAGYKSASKILARIEDAE